MRRVRALGLILSLLTVSLAAPLHAAINEPTPPPALEVIREDGRGVSLLLELPAVDTTPVTLAGRTFQAIAIPGGGVKGELGEPAIPTLTRLVAIPDGVGVVARSVAHDKEEIAGVTLAPVQDGEGSAFAYDETAYARDAFDSTSDVLVSEPMIFRDLRVVAVTCMPVHYNPGTKTLAVTRRLEVELEFTGSDPRNAAAPRHATIAPSFDQLYRSVVANYAGAQDLGSTVSPGTYLVICPNDTAVTNRLSHLVAWRERQGYPVVVATTAQAGTTNAQIKNYIQNAYTSWPVPPEYVVLVGDAAAIPTWYETLSGYNGEGDHPYTMLSGGDILADVHLGRLSYSTTTELLIIVNKTVNYETQPFIADTTWFTRACVVGDPASGTGPSAIETGQWFKSLLLHRYGYTQVDTVFTSPFASQMQTAFNRGDTFITYRGFVGMSGWSNTNTNSLTNGWRMPFAPILTCGTGGFAGESSCRSEAFLRAGTYSGTPPVTTPKGAIGAIGTATLGTHTRYNNCMLFGILHGMVVEGQRTMGAALTRGKLELFLNYYATNPSQAQIWAHWNNLMGDPAVDIWTGVPQLLTVSYAPTLALGANSVPITVTQGATPVAGALVCLRKGTEVQAVGTTDEAGTIELPIVPTTAGTMLVTVTKHNVQPFLATIAVGTQNVFLGYVSAQIDDTIGSDDGLINPGETIGLAVQVRNTGTALATGISATLASTDPYITITNGSGTFPDVPAGGSAWSNANFSFDVDPACPHDHRIRYALDVTAAEGQSHSLIELTVVSADLVAGATTLYNAGANGRLDPGETVEMSLVLANQGGATATAMTGTLVALSDFISVSDGSATFGTIAPGGAANNAGDHFTLSAATNTYGGYLATFMLITNFSGGLVDTTIITLTVGQRATTDPVGPDRYGYYAFDNTDTSYPDAPVYSWLEISLDGTEVVLGDYGDTQDKSRMVDLPFPFKYYGQTYNRATICSNGWLAMGETYLTSYRNWTIPGAGGPWAMLAVFWDELYQLSGTSRCFQKYDAANHRWIVEWSNFRNLSGGGTVTVQAILHDPAFYPTDTGDGIIVFQYAATASSDGTDGYFTVGIEDHNQTDGLLISYFNRYPLGAATVQPGRAIKFVPQIQEHIPTAAPAAEVIRTNRLAPCRPNPFNPQTTISFTLAADGPATLSIYDVGGRLIETLVDQALPAGEHVVTWNGTSESGQAVASGIYFMRLETTGFKQVRQMTLLR